MASFYWVGGAGNWDSVNFLSWASTSGGSGGSAGYFPPTGADNVTFDSNSGSGTVTFTNSGVNAASLVTFNSPNILLNLAGNFAIVSAFTLTAGSLSTNGYSFNASALLSTNSNTRSISFGASTITLSAVSPIDFTNSSGLTFNAGTSQINLSYNSASTATLAGGNLSFYNVTFTGTASNIIVISGSNTFNNLIFSSATPTSTTFSGENTFNNLTITGKTSAGLNFVTFSGNQTITGTFTILASASAVCRTFLRSDIVEVTRTLTCNAFATAINVDFRDITIAGSAAPISGTRFGNAKGNSGINFPAAKTVYFRATGNASWGASTSWSATSGGTVDGNQFPLAQDTAIFPATTYPSSGATVTLNANYAIGTIDMSLRTTNTIVFAFGTFAFSVYGDFISSPSSFSSYTGTAGGAALSFYGRTTQNITSAGQYLRRSIVIGGGGTVKLLDALVATDTTLSSIISGTLDLNGYNATIGSSISITGTSPRGIIFAGATLTVGSLSTGTGTVWDATDITNLTLDGTGTLNVNNGSAASPKTFIGGGYQNYPNISFSSDLLFAGVTVTGSNKFGDHTSYGVLSPAIGLKFTGGTVNEFSSFILSGNSGVSIPLKSTNTTQATLRKPTAWVMGPSSTNVIGNTGLTFSGGTAGVNDYLQVSYINGVVSSSSNTSNFFMMF
jgi:hypothetical protein